ncbi:MAG: ABC transporter substrate-binding protein [Blautia sp.]|nr:ABC transporter substrate-binding protein [Blautia sp.]
MKFRKIAALALAAMMTVFTASAASAEIIGADIDAPGTEKTDETLKIALASEPSAIWGAPGGQTENEAQMIFSALADTLVKVDKTTGEVLPNLATAWEWVDDTHLKLTLRDDVTMNDGAPFTADDVVYSVKVWAEGSANTDTGRYVVSAVADDEHTVTIEYNTVCPDLLSMLSWSNFGVVSEAQVEACGGLEAAAKAPVVGCGKYIFKEWAAGQSITLERNENYWNPDYAGYYKTIVLSFTNDPAAREMTVESGDAQVAVDIPVIQAATYAESENVNVVIYDFGQVTHLWYNMLEDHPTSDIRVRQAIDKALDFDALAMVGTAGTGTAALGYLSEVSPYYDATYTAEERAVDVEGAKALLEEAGYADGLDLTILGTQADTITYTVIQEQLRAIGINLTLNTPDIPSFVGDAFGGNYDLIVVGEWIPNTNPSAFTFMNQANIDSGFIIGGPKVTTEEKDSLIQQIVASTDVETAKGLMVELWGIMKEEMIESNLYPELKAGVMAKDLKGYNTIERGFIDITGFYK